MEDALVRVMEDVDDDLYIFSGSREDDIDLWRNKMPSFCLLEYFILYSRQHARATCSGTAVSAYSICIQHMPFSLRTQSRKEHRNEDVYD